MTAPADIVPWQASRLMACVGQPSGQGRPLPSVPVPVPMDRGSIINNPTRSSQNAASVATAVTAAAATMPEVLGERRLSRIAPPRVTTSAGPSEPSATRACLTIVSGVVSET